MKNFLRKIQGALVVGGLILLSAPTVLAQNKFSETMGDSRLETWVSVEIGNNNTTSAVKENEFVFHNLSAHPVSFRYNGMLVQLSSGGYSRSFKGVTPRSLPNARAIIDGIPIQSYYNSLAFEKEYQDLANLLNSKTQNSDAGEIKNRIDLLTKALSQVQAIRSTLPEWFTKNYSYDQKLSQVNTWLKSQNDLLEKKISENGR
jgi:hypothetical protein